MWVRWLPSAKPSTGFGRTIASRYYKAPFQAKPQYPHSTTQHRAAQHTTTRRLKFSSAINSWATFSCDFGLFVRISPLRDCVFFVGVIGGVDRAPVWLAISFRVCQRARKRQDVPSVAPEHSVGVGSGRSRIRGAWQPDPQRIPRVSTIGSHLTPGIGQKNQPKSRVALAGGSIFRMASQSRRVVEFFLQGAPRDGIAPAPTGSLPFTERQG